MKRSLNVLALLTFVIVQFFAVSSARAQNPGGQESNKPADNRPLTNQNPFLGWRQRNHKLPLRAVPGSTPGRRAVFNHFTPEQRKAVIDEFRPYLAAAMKKAKAEHEAAHQKQDLLLHGGPFDRKIKHRPTPGEPLETALAFTDEHGNTRIVPAVGDQNTSGSARWPEAVLAQMGFRPEAAAPPGSRGDFSVVGPRNAFASARWPNGALRDASVSFPARSPYKPAAFGGGGAGLPAPGGALAQTFQSGGPGPQACGAYADADNDGLDDCFENNLAAAFTPNYHISAGETDNFATFQNSAFAVDTLLGHSPPNAPYSYARVTPQIFASTGGSAFYTDPYTNIQYGFIRIDYLTLWDHDSGLVSRPACINDINTLALDGVYWQDWSDFCWNHDLPWIPGIPTELESHPLDEERSAALVMARTTAPGTWDPNPGNYTLIQWYTAAHEDTFVDHSGVTPTLSVPAYNHINLWLSQSKHSTYTFNPDYLPLLPEWMIWGYYGALSAWYADVVWGCILNPNASVCLDCWDYLGCYNYLDQDYWTYYEWCGVGDYMPSCGWCDNACDFNRLKNYLLLLYIGDTLFFECITENWTPDSQNPPTLAVTQTNVGELPPGNVLNNAGFILDQGCGANQPCNPPNVKTDYVYFKLTKVLWTSVPQ
jgi:hypothetical protein